MITQARLMDRAEAILRQRYQLRPRQRTLIVYDGPKEKIGKSFVEVAENIGAQVKVFQLAEERFARGNLENLLAEINGGRCSMFVNIFESRPEENQARLQIINSQKDRQKFRIAHCPGITEAMLEIDIDLSKMADSARTLLARLEGASLVRARTDLGTDLEIDVHERPFHEDVIPKQRDLSNFPCGEVYCAPVEDAVNGTLVANGTASNFGRLPSPLLFDIEGGRIKDLRWANPHYGNNSLLLKIREFLLQSSGSDVIGELGVGLAPYSLCGNMLLDEKVAGTIHIAFGHNILFGGKNTSRSHIDFLVRDPELTVNYSGNQPPRTIMRHGRLLLQSG